MADESNKTPAQPNPAMLEAEARTRISDLQSKLSVLKQEVHSIKGKLANRDPAVLQQLKQENEQLKARAAKLRAALFAVISDSEQPRNADEATLDFEVLRQSALQYFKKTNVDPELWKNLES